MNWCSAHRGSSGQSIFGEAPAACHLLHGVHGATGLGFAQGCSASQNTVYTVLVSLWDRKDE